MTDFPAAHSMDTEWFAVDANGNLAIFDSGENGAVPQTNRRIWQKASIDGLHSFFWEIAKFQEDRLINLPIPSDRSIQSLQLKPAAEAIDYKGWHDGYFLHLISDEIIPSISVKSLDYSYKIRFAGADSLIYVSDCDRNTLDLAIENKQIIAWQRGREFRSTLATFFGFYVYDMFYYNPAPYDRIGKPIYPLVLDNLSEHLQDLISWNWFDRLKFEESPIIQPLEHTPCDTWRGTSYWIDSEGNEWTEHFYD